MQALFTHNVYKCVRVIHVIVSGCFSFVSCSGMYITPSILLLCSNHIPF